MGKGKGKDSTAERRALPLASLKDPDAFGPPPKRVNYAGASPHNDVAERDERDIDTRATEGIEDPEVRAVEEAKSGKKIAPPIPYRADRTEPPLRGRVHNDLRAGAPKNLNMEPNPSLPPRLPPRQNSASPQSQSSQPSSYSDPTTVPPKSASANPYLNQGALTRLGSSGINVPGLGIGGRSDALKRDKRSQGNSDSKTSPAAGGEGSQLNDLQSKFSRSSSPRSPPPMGSQSQGTTLAQKQAALKTASAFRNDPSSVSFADAKATASTMNNFRERHGDQVASGLKSANALNQEYKLSSKVGSQAPNSTTPTNSPEPPSVKSGCRSANALSQKYNLSSKVGGYASSAKRIEPETPPVSSTSANAAASDSQAVLPTPKKPPPPPPKKYLSFNTESNSISSAPTPPPIPTSSKPKAY